MVELCPYIETEIFHIIQLTEDELLDIALLQAEKRQLSKQDCSAIVWSQKAKGNLLTSDNNFRKFAIKKVLTVHGHLWIFDKMVEKSAISPQNAIDKLTELREVVNPRLNLPKHECDQRIALWEIY